MNRPPEEPAPAGSRVRGAAGCRRRQMKAAAAQRDDGCTPQGAGRPAAVVSRQEARATRQVELDAWSQLQ